MTKAEVIQEIANKTGVDKADVSTTIEAFFKVIKNALSENENVYFRNFGSFVVKKRAQKVARIISQNKSIIIPEHYIPSFKPAKSFVAKVKDSTATMAIKA
ncbi:MAG TPA: integration host factor subunit beta [Bacteroidetes bacterium]|nr:integration host factor subunit beta [Bacteroidota bacterium]